MNSRQYNAPLLCGGWASGEASDSPRSHLVFGGGGGEGATGVKNNFIVASYDAESRELSEALDTFSTDDDVAVTMAMHPNGHEFVCSMIPNKKHNGKLKHFKLASEKILRIESGDQELQPLHDAGEQRSLAFNADGKLLASGGEDGHLRVFKWPSLEVVLDRPGSHRSIKDLDFSLDGSYLAATDDVGPSRIWDLKKLAPTAALPLSKAGFCRFSRDGASPSLYVTTVIDSKGYVTIWNTQWKKVGSKKVLDEPISAFNISPDGKLLAVGSSEGNIMIINASKLSVLQRIKGAHMFFITAVDFSPNNRLLLSVSGDWSARVSPVGETSQRVWRPIWLLLIILLAAIFSLVLSRGLGRGISDSHDMI